MEGGLVFSQICLLQEVITPDGVPKAKSHPEHKKCQFALRDELVLVELCKFACWIELAYPKGMLEDIYM